MDFDAENPFPLCNSSSFSYAEAKAHAALADEYLGLQAERVEAAVRANPRYSNVESPESPQEYWRELPVQSLHTPYLELRAILHRIEPQAADTVVDLGSGLGRMGHIIGRHHPGVRFIGYELVEERVIESRRCLAPFAYPDVHIEQADLSAPDFTPTPAGFYFLYDFGSRAAVEKSLRDLLEISRSRRIVVAGRGRLSRSIIERQHPWLSDVHPPDHHDHYSIYRSRE